MQRREDKRQRHHQPRQREATVAEQLDRLRQGEAPVARREHRDGQRERRRDQRGEPGRGQRVQHRGADAAQRLARRQPAQQPVAEQRERQGEREREQRRHQAERRPAPAAERRGGNRPRAASRAVVTALAARPQLERDQREGDADQHERQRRGAGEVEPGLVAHEQRPRQRVVAQQRDRAEIGDRVQRHEQPAGRQRGTELRQHHPAERGPAPVAEAARCLLEARVEAEQRRTQREQQVGVGEQREHEHRAPEAVDRGQPLPRRTARARPEAARADRTRRPRASRRCTRARRAAAPRGSTVRACPAGPCASSARRAAARSRRRGRSLAAASPAVRSARPNVELAAIASHAASGDCPARTSR